MFFRIARSGRAVPGWPKLPPLAAELRDLNLNWDGLDGRRRLPTIGPQDSRWIQAWSVWQSSEGSRMHYAL